MTSTPSLTQFKVELKPSGLAHLVFDCPDRSMNVFSNKAIHELGEFAEWLHTADVKGLLIRSGKATGFCAGADLTELGVAYDMIMAASPADRFDLAYNHFFPLSHAIRRLETAGKPIAAAIGGVALGGGCELALGAHYRVLANSPKALLGLPECQVGLLPGAGGTQRMPRLVGVEAGLQVLLQGRTYTGEEAVKAGLAGRLAEPGQEVEAAEEWLLSAHSKAVQPWDAPDFLPAEHRDYAAIIDAHRQRELARMLGHEPAPLAILDCVELGMMQPLDGAIRSEMSVFAKLIQRAEPRNMIRAMFLGKQAFDKAKRSPDGVSEDVVRVAAKAASLVSTALETCPELQRAGFGEGRKNPVQNRVGHTYWITTQPALLQVLKSIGHSLERSVSALTEAEKLQLDYLSVLDGSVPGYIGGASGLVALDQSIG